MRFHRFELRKANGNLSNTVAGVLGDWSYTYDAQNRLIRATGGPSSVVAEFYYDAGNRCVKRVINGVTTYLIYDGWSLLEERNLAGNLLARYYHGPVIDELLCRVTETNTVYFHHDGLGSTVALTDSTGNVVESYTYDVYGQPSILSTTYHLLPTSSVTNRFLFTGREYLPELALYDYRHRFYSPVLGRFLQLDPVRFEAGDVNLYRYVYDNVVNETDVFGLAVNDVYNATGRLRGLPCGPTTSSFGEVEALYQPRFGVDVAGPMVTSRPGEGEVSSLTGPVGIVSTRTYWKSMKPTTRPRTACRIANICRTECCAAGHRWIETWQEGFIEGYVVSDMDPRSDPLNPSYVNARCEPQPQEEGVALERCRKSAKRKCTGQ